MNQGTLDGIKPLKTCLFRKEETLVRGWPSHTAHYLPQPQLIKWQYFLPYLSHKVVWGSQNHFEKHFLKYNYCLQNKHQGLGEKPRWIKLTPSLTDIQLRSQAWKILTGSILWNKKQKNKVIRVTKLETLFKPQVFSKLRDNYGNHDNLTSVK